MAISRKSFISPRGCSCLWSLAVSLCLGLTAWTLLLAIARPAEADVGPVALDEHGYTLAPAEATRIQMISETVLIDVAYPITMTYDAYARDSGEVKKEVEGSVGAQVTADFLFRNPQTETQTLAVGFPVALPSSSELQQHLYINFHPVQQLRAFVNGEELDTRQEMVDGSAWRVWGMDFPPGDTHVRVTYLMSTIEELGYVLHTGAPWAGPIGQVDLIVRFPCPARDVLLGPDPVTGYSVEGHDLHWHYENLEPIEADDLVFHFSAATCWSRQATREAGSTATPQPTPLVSTPTPPPTIAPTATPSVEPSLTPSPVPLPSVEPGVTPVASPTLPIASPSSAVPITGFVWGGMVLAFLIGAVIYWSSRK
jgi:hypothetical protein